MRFVYLILAVSLLQSLCSVNAQANEFSLSTAKAGDKIPGCYVVLFKKQDFKQKADVNATALEISAKSLATKFGKLRSEFKGEIKGFTVCDVKSENSLAALKSNGAVQFVEQDVVMKGDAIVTQKPTPSWGLDRIDSRSLPNNGQYMYNNSFANVDVFVLDTGIRITHTEFSNGRASHGFTAFGTSISDGNGHGTHVAGTIGGVKYGVCKHCRLISVKVLSDSGSGSLTSFVNGVNYVLANRRPGIPALASMSLGFSGIVASADSAVQSLINAGVVTVIAAGNSNINACNVSPARVPGAITVGATDSTDTRSSFSNFGSCVDIFAPGSAITSAYHTSNTATASLSGTSMAAPHVAGVAAAYRSYNPAKTLAEVNTYIIETLSTKNVVKSAGTLSPNRLLYSRIDLVR